MAKKKVSFDELSLENVRKANVTNGDKNITNTHLSNTQISNVSNDSAMNDLRNDNVTNDSQSASNVQESNIVSDNSIENIRNIDSAKDDKNIANTHSTNTQNSTTPNTNDVKGVNYSIFSRVREHIYKLLGDKNQVEVKLSELIKELKVNANAFYRYLKILRETDFVVKKLRYSTEISRLRRVSHQMVVEEAIAMKEESNSEAH